MKVPKTLAGWCLIAFLLVYGIATFWSFSHSGDVVGGLALAAGVLSIIGR